MTNESELERLSRVYRHYRRDTSAQARWDGQNAGNRAIVRERRQVMSAVLKTHGFWPLNEMRILDVGCGSGKVLAGLLDWGARPENLYGVDLLPERIDAALQTYPAIHFQCGNAEELEYPDMFIHLVLVFTVFSSILDRGMAGKVAHEITRVLRPGGAVLWYDFRYNNPWNPHVRGMTRRLIRTLFQEFEMHLETITLLPPLARRLDLLMPALYPALATIPLLRTHYLGLLVKPAASLA